MPSRSDDFDWLYRKEKPTPPADDATRIMPEEELRQLRGERSGSAASTPDRGRSEPAAVPPTRVHEQQPRPQPSTAAAPAGTPPAAPPPGGSGTGGRDGRPPRRRRRVRTVLRTIVTLLVAWLLFLIGVPIYAWSQTTKVDAEPSGSRPPNQPGTAILLVGSDSREGLSAKQRKRLGTGSVEGQRTDTMMILYVAPGGKAALISLPRDLYLPIPGHGSNKLNAAYAFGGPELLVQTVEQNTGLRMDGYVEIGFGGFVTMVDAVGGVEVCLKTPMKDADSHTNLPKGCQTLDGVQALGYVRMRKADPEGDIGRAKRQREVLAKVGKKAASPATVLNPVRYWNVTNGVAGSLKRGAQTSAADVAMMGVGMLRISQGKGTTLVVPISNPNATTPAGSSVLWDESKAKALFAQLAQGDADNLKKYES